MTNTVIGYFGSFNEIKDVEIEFTAGVSTHGEYMRNGVRIRAVGENDATKWAIIALPTGQSPEVFYFYLFVNSSQSFSITYQQFDEFRNYSSSTGFEPWRKTYYNEITTAADSMSKRPFTVDLDYYSAVIRQTSSGVLDENNMPPLIEGQNIVNLYGAKWSTLYETDFVNEVMGKKVAMQTGQGLVTLNLKSPGQTLTFTSNLLGTVKTVLITGDQTVRFLDSPTVEPDWEILWMYSEYVGGVFYKGKLLIDSNYNCTYSDDQTEMSGNLLRVDSNWTVYAKENCVASLGNCGSRILQEFSFTKDMAMMGMSGYNSMWVIARKPNSVKVPYELGFYRTAGNSEACIIKKNDGAFIGWSQQSSGVLSGDYLKLTQGSIWQIGSNRAGKIIDADSEVSGYIQEIYISGNSYYAEGRFGIAVFVPL